MASTDPFEIASQLVALLVQWRERKDVNEALTESVQKIAAVMGNVVHDSVGYDIDIEVDGAHYSAVFGTWGDMGTGPVFCVDGRGLEDLSGLTSPTVEPATQEDQLRMVGHMAALIDRLKALAEQSVDSRVRDAMLAAQMAVEEALPELKQAITDAKTRAQLQSDVEKIAGTISTTFFEDLQGKRVPAELLSREVAGHTFEFKVFSRTVWLCMDGLCLEDPGTYAIPMGRASSDQHVAFTLECLPGVGQWLADISAALGDPSLQQAITTAQAAAKAARTPAEPGTNALKSFVVMAAGDLTRDASSPTMETPPASEAPGPELA